MKAEHIAFSGEVQLLNWSETHNGGAKVTRQFAIANGLPHYFTGKPCKHGHISKRQVANKSCLTCSNEITKKYRAAHVRQISADRAATYYADSEKYLLRSAEWAKNNPQKIKARIFRWRKNNPETVRQHKSTSEAKRRCQMVGKLPRFIVSRLKKLQRNKCACCKCSLSKTGYHMDHVTPLARGGAHVALNIQLLCPSCNLSKNAKDPIAFMQSRGYLL